MTKNKKFTTEKLVLGAVLTAFVLVLQLLGASIRFGAFSISLVLIPVVIGAASCGALIGAWLGYVFGVAVLISGDAASFMAISVPGTIATVLLKGTLCGLIAGLTYNFLAKYNEYLAVYTAAIVCPIVNTGVFLLGCSVFFLDAVSLWGASAGFNSTVAYMFLSLAGINFLVELAANVLLAPTVVTVLKYFKKH